MSPPVKRELVGTGLIKYPNYRNIVPKRLLIIFFFQAEDGIRDIGVTGVQTCALPIWNAAQARSIASAGRSGIGVKVGIRIPKPRSARRIRMCSAVKIAAVPAAAPGPSARVVATKIAGNKSARRNG